MVDYFSLALTHGLLAIAAWRLLWRDDLDRDAAKETAEDTPLTAPAADPRFVLKREEPVRRA